MNTKQEVNRLAVAIEAARQLGGEDLRALYDFILPRLKAASAVKTMQAAAQYRPGDVAQFFSAKHGRTIKIIIDRINTKTVSGTEVVEAGRRGTQWRVSPQFLEPATA